MLNSFRPTRLYLYTENLRFNIRNIKRHVGDGVKVIAVVKANAYNFGIKQAAWILREEGIKEFAVATIDEGAELRDAGILSPILILGQTFPEDAKVLVDYDLTPAVSDSSLPREFSKEAAKRETIAKVHLKVDTGMGRIGHFPDTALSVLEEIHQMRNISVEGIFTHFSVADERDKEYTRLQLERFKKLLSELDGRGILPPVKHCANSAAILDMPETYMDAVRPGIILYGMYPSGEVSRSIEIKPVMEVKTRISFVKEQPPGSSVGYGRTYNTKGYERIAVLPVGYADGYTRLFSNKAFVLVGGRRAPVVGNICMDQTMIDVTHIPDVHVGDEVVLLGKQGGEEISAEELASILGTINYEVVNLFSSWRVGRVYV